MKVQVKRDIESYFFVTQKRSRQALLEFFSNPNRNVQQVSQLPISIVPFFKEYFNPPVRINKMVNKHSVYYNLKDTSSHISTDTLGLYLQNVC